MFLNYLLKTFFVFGLFTSISAQSFAFDLMQSNLPDRSNPQILQGATVSDDVYVFVTPESGISQVEFYLDDPNGTLIQRERKKPYDLAGGSTSSANPFDTNGWSDGSHTLFAVITTTSGATETISASIQVDNNSPALQVSTETVTIISDIDGPVQISTLGISTNDGSNIGVNISENASWLSVPATANTPGNVQLDFDPSGLSAGTYTTLITFTAAGYIEATATAELNIQDPTAGTYQLLLSESSARTNPVPLSGSVLTGNAYIFVSPETGISNVEFYFDDLNSSLVQKESFAPYDLAGGSSGSANPFDTTTLSDGTHTLFAVVNVGGDDQIISAPFTVNNTASAAFTLNPSTIDASLSSGFTQDIMVLLGLNAAGDGSSPDYTVTGGAPWATIAPLSGNAPTVLTVSIDSAGLAEGNYSTSFTISSTTLPDIQLPVSLAVTGPPPAPHLVAAPTSISIASMPDEGIVTRSVSINTSDSNPATVTIVENTDWLALSTTSTASGQSIDVFVDTDGLADGVYNAQITFSAAGYDPVNVPVDVTISSVDNCAPLICSTIRVDLPYILDFDTDAGHLLDANGVGTGFTYFQPATNGPNYDPNLLSVDLANGELLIDTTAGIQYEAVNSLANALGVGFSGANQFTEISTIIRQPSSVPVGGKYEQAGLWFGTDEDNYIKLVYISRREGYAVEFLLETNGEFTSRSVRSVPDLSAGELRLQLLVDPNTQQVTGRYALDEGAFIDIGAFDTPPEFFSFDAAGIDPEIGTRSFAGIMATHRNGSPLTYRFEEFRIQEGIAPPEGMPYAFSTTSHNINFPTSMVWGPDNRLYVTELFGTIHALTYDADLNVIDDEVITSLVDQQGPRLTLGIEVDPNSTPGNVDLWLSHSSPSVNAGALNSGLVTKLSNYTAGSGYGTVENVITGLPRAIANHGPNSLHFGSDGRLYVAIGGNTGAGAPTDVETEFGDRPEQYFAAGIIVADVYAPAFNGNCTPVGDPILGTPNCDVVNHATGMRNPYDFVEHSNGFTYATDNGLGVTGAFPPSPNPPCFGFGSTNSVASGGQNPGEQPDLLYLVNPGAYYGHPNPSRNECVFKDGSLQGVTPLPNYQPPIADLGLHRSANGIIEVKSNNLGCGKLQGDLLITNFSTGNNITQVKLSNDGTLVESQANLIDGFNSPLTLSENSNGDLFVAEFGANRITALRGIDPGCWESLSNMPQEIIDAASAAIGNDLYLVGGKRNTHTNEAYRYDTVNDIWSPIASKPGSAVENAAAASVDGYLYVFGGSTDPFSGAVNESYRYDPATDSWTQIADLPTARGGVRAEATNGLIYVIGGLDNAGNSLNIVEVYDPATDTWSAVTPMSQERDNPGTAVINGMIYAVGGRHRLSDGTVFNEALNSIEAFNPMLNTWTTLTPMPTGRRTMTIGTVGDKLQVIGGEINFANGSGVFSQNEQYDPQTDSWIQLGSPPQPKHGAGYATINGRIYQAGGGDQSGLSYTATVDRY